MERERWIDMGKGIAILSVVFGHLSSLDSKNSIYLLVYAFHMPIFWIISGMLLYGRNYDDISMVEVIKKKAKSIMYPYTIFSIIIVVYNYIGLNLNLVSKNHFKLVIKNSIYFRGMNCLWFLPVLFVAEIIFIYLIKHRQNMVLWGIVFAIVATLIAVFLSKTSLFKENPMKEYKRYGLIIPKVCFALSFISLGYIAIKYFKVIKKCWLILALMGIGLSYYVIKNYHKKTDINYCVIHSPKIFWICAIIISISILIICKILEKNSLLEYFGKMSLLIMCTHRTFNLTDLSQYIVSKVGVSSYYIGLNICLEFLGVILLDVIVIELINRKMKYLISYDEFKQVIKRLYCHICHRELIR